MNSTDPSPAVVTETRAELAAQLAAARQLYMTFDPDSPPWAIEGELERLELELAELAELGTIDTDVPTQVPKGGVTDSNSGGSKAR
jgi:hypothetical protein